MNEMILRLRAAATTKVVSSRSARRVMAVGAFAIATALGAQVEVVIGPVPLTLQTLFVILAGVMLGARLGAASQIAYLAMGIAGLPVFSGGAMGPAWLLGPTGGYLLAFPVAAFVAGAVAGPVRRSLGGGVRLLAGLLAGSAAVLLVGSAQLAALTGDPARAVAAGVAPFLAGDLVKVALAFLIAWRTRGRTLGLL